MLSPEMKQAVRRFVRDMQRKHDQTHQQIPRDAFIIRNMTRHDQFPDLLEWLMKHKGSIITKNVGMLVEFQYDRPDWFDLSDPEVIAEALAAGGIPFEWLDTGVEFTEDDEYVIVLTHAENPFT